MFSVLACAKVLRCSKRHAHDWRACPFAHPTENARRRDPREFKYCALACPDYKQGFCIRGDVCPYSHGVFECWLHPSRYRTQLCKDGSNCHRPVCFFAHSLPELRAPTYTWVPSSADLAARPYSATSPTNSGPGGVNSGAGGGVGGGTLPPAAAAMAAMALGAVSPDAAASMHQQHQQHQLQKQQSGQGMESSAVAAEARALLSHTLSGIPVAASNTSEGAMSGPGNISPRGVSEHVSSSSLRLLA